MTLSKHAAAASGVTRQHLGITSETNGLPARIQRQKSCVEPK